MTIIRLIYLAVVLIAGAFVVMYVDSLSLILLLVTLALPIILFLLLVLARVLTKITVEPNELIATRGSAVSLRFNIKNLSFVALPALRTEVIYTTPFSDEIEKTEVTFPLHALTKQTAYFDINSNHLGTVKLYIGDIIFSDYFRLFNLKLKVRKEFEITFLPDIKPLTIDIRPNTLLGVDSDVFSKTKKGDDPSEVFAIRDYVGGDKLNRIHWKLSSKTDNIMVKDYSLPINNNIAIVAEIASTKDENALDDIDTVIETVFSISNSLCEAEIMHKICWYDKKTEQFFSEEVKTTSEMFAALGLMLASKVGDSWNSMAFWKQDGDVCSHLAYVTALPVDDAISDLGEISYATYYSIITVGNEGVTATPSGIMQFAPVKNGNITNALSGFVL